MAEVAVTCLMESVSKLLIHHANLISGAEHELRQLMDDLNSLKAFLRVLAKKHNNEASSREIERQIKEVIYDMEDTIDGCLPAAETLKYSFGEFLSVTAPTNIAIACLYTIFSVAYGGMASKVMYLRKRKVMPMIETLRAKVLAFELSDQLRTTNLKEDYEIMEEHVVGFKDEKETIISYLMKPKEELDVISIIGMPGLGKTTLAWSIYRDVHVDNAFPIKIWIHVSKKFQIRDVCQRILEKVKGNDSFRTSSAELIETVQISLRDRGFLLVMDDICSVDDWQVIKQILPKSNGRGKVLITSCDYGVGAYANGNRMPHKLRFLNEMESWELLQLKVFRNLEACPHELEKVGMVIVKKCGGLPIQIVAVGGILANKLSKSQTIRLMQKEWHKVSENIKFLLQKEKRISRVRELTYGGLPGDLSDCFLYMGVFPEDYEISAWRLTRLWIAEGFVQPKQGQSLEETAMQNLDGLISNNLVMVGQIDANGKVKTCRVHNMIREFCVEKAREQNLFQEIRSSGEGVLESPVSELQMTRRLFCVHSNAPTLLSQVPNSTRVRSLLSFSEPPTDSDPSYISTIVDNFILLKVLAIRLQELPHRVTKLFHLRYITLSVDNLNILPKSLSKLWNLQTLEVDTKSHFITMKANIWKLVWLRHLKTNAAIFLTSKGKGDGGVNLQTLSQLSPEACTEDVCVRARNLKTLRIRGKLDTFLRNMPLGSLERLEKLKLMNELFCEVASEKALYELPIENSFPPHLKRLTLSKTFLTWKNMSTLATIKTLEVLKLKDNAFTGIFWSTVDYCFSSLEFLLIIETDLGRWEVSTDSFPSLKCLVLKKCENLNEVPMELAKTLEKLDIEFLGESAVKSAIHIAKLRESKAKSGIPFELSISPHMNVISYHDQEKRKSAKDLWMKKLDEDDEFGGEMEIESGDDDFI